MPVVTVLLVLANLAVFGLELALGGEAVCYAYGLVPAELARSGAVWPVFSSLFLHDPENLSHLVGNMALLAVCGTIVERALGALRFGAVYAAAGAFGALAHLAVDPTSTTPMVGASGAIFGVLAVAVALRPRLIVVVAPMTAVNVWWALSGAQNGVSYGAHIGGLVAGVLVATLLRSSNNQALEAA